MTPGATGSSAASSHHHVDGARAGRAGGYDDEIAGGRPAQPTKAMARSAAPHHIGLGHAAPETEFEA